LAFSNEIGFLRRVLSGPNESLSYELPPLYSMHYTNFIPIRIILDKSELHFCGNYDLSIFSTNQLNSFMEFSNANVLDNVCDIK